VTEKRLYLKLHFYVCHRASSFVKTVAKTSAQTRRIEKKYIKFYIFLCDMNPSWMKYCMVEFAGQGSV
jgi:hypothetical protein